MPVTNVVNDAAARTMTMTAEFDAPVDRVWQLYADPRQLEQWWTPPGFPLTITDHDLTVGGMVRAHVTGPEGQKVQAYWRITAVDAPTTMAWEDGFLDEQGEPNAAMATLAQLTLGERAGGGTVMTLVTTFLSDESMQEYLEMPMEEQYAVTVAQAEALLSAS